MAAVQSVFLFSIFTSLPVWGIIIANIGYFWSKAYTDVLMPQYMEQLGLSMKDNGLVSALPPLGKGRRKKLLFTDMSVKERGVRVSCFNV